MATPKIVLSVKAHGEHAIDKVRNDLLKLAATSKAVKMNIGNDLMDQNKKWKKHFDYVDKTVKEIGGAITKFVTMSAKMATVQMAALGAAMMAVHGAFVLGNGSMKAFRYLAQLGAGAFGVLTIAATTAAAAMRENSAAMYAYKGVGKSEFGSGLNQIRVEMRAMARDADLAGLGAKNLDAVFAAVQAKGGNYTQASQGLLKGLMDFASAGQPLEQGAKAAGELINALQNPKANMSTITASFKALGPEAEKALRTAQSKGVHTVEGIKKSILDGTLAIYGGVSGQFAAFNDTLFNRFKKAKGLMVADAADFGQQFLAPAKDALTQLAHIFRKTMARLSGVLSHFGNGNYMDKIVSLADKLANFFVKFISTYLPKTDGMMKGMGDWMSRFKDGWNTVLEKLRPLLDAAKILENMFMNMVRPLKEGIGEAFTQVRNLIVEHKDAFEEFGTRVGSFLKVFSKYSTAIREIFVDALPFINKMLDGVTKMADMFLSVLGSIRGILGGGSGGSFGLLVGLLAAGRSMKKTIGGVVPDMKKVNKMDVKAGQVNLTGVTGKGQISATAATYANGQPMPTGGLPTGSQQVLLANKQAGLRSQMIQGGGGAQGAAGVVKNPTAAKAAAQAKYVPPPPKMFQRVPGGYSQWAKNNPGLVQPSLSMKLRSPFREARDTKFRAKLIGDENNKGWNNSMGLSMATSLGLGLLASHVDPAAQGALSLGAGVAAFNPMAGAAIGLGGAAATTTNAGVGMLTGGASGAMAGFMVAGPAGAAVGAVLGAATGAIMGVINNRKKDKKAAQDAGHKAAANILDSYIEGMGENVANLAKVGLLNSESAKNMLTAQIDKTTEVRTSIEDALLKSGDAQKEFMTTNRQTLFKTYDDNTFAAAQRNVTDTLTTLSKDLEEQNSARTAVLKLYTTRNDDLQQRFSMSSEEIFKLANETGTNLMDATMNYGDMVNSLTKGLISNAAELQQAFGDIFGNMMDDLDKMTAAAKSPSVINEAGRTIYDQVQSTGGITKEGGLDFFTTMAEQMPAYYKGNNVQAAFEFVKQFGGPGGTAYTQENSPLFGQYDNMRNAIGAEDFNIMIKHITDSIGQIGRGILTSGMVSGNVGINATGAAATDIRSQMNAAVNRIGNNEAFTAYQKLASADLTQKPNQEALQQWFTDHGVKIEGLEGGNLFKDMGDAATNTATAALNMSQASDVFKNAVNTMVNGLALYFTSKVPLTQGGIMDTHTPRGDTSSSLASTMSAHNAVNGSLTGKRTVTSSYRNFALGSINSDHITGKALDVVGQNLGQYQTGIRSGGGFAEFHGVGDTRHLHVVPNPNPIGDSTVAAAIMTRPIGGGSGSPTYNINIAGGASSAEEIANVVLYKIKQIERSNRERA